MVPRNILKNTPSYSTSGFAVVDGICPTTPHTYNASNNSLGTPPSRYVPPNMVPSPSCKLALRSSSTNSEQPSSSTSHDSRTTLPPAAAQWTGSWQTETKNENKTRKNRTGQNRTGQDSTGQDRTRSRARLYVIPLDLRPVVSGTYYHGGPCIIGPMTHIKTYIFTCVYVQYLVLFTMAPRNKCL